MWEIFLELIVMVDAVQERDYNSDALGIVLLEFFFFFLESFNLWRPLLISILYHQTKTSINFSVGGD